MEPTDAGLDTEGEDRGGGRGRGRTLAGIGCASVSIATMLIAIVGIVAVVVAAGLLLRSFDLDLELGAGDPGPGTASQRVGVLVAPTEGLTDEATVRVASDAFEPSSVVGVAVCLREADTDEAGVEACDEVQGERFATDGAGVLDASYRVPRRIRVGGQVHDCGAGAGRCVLVAADANDYDRSGGQPLTFADGAGGREPPVTRPMSRNLPATRSPGGAVAPGSDLTVRAEGFQPHEPVLLAWCREDFVVDGPGACEPVDDDAALTALLGRTVPAGLPRADADGVVTATFVAKGQLDPVLGDPLRCGGLAGNCTLVVAAAADTARSAVVPYALGP
jgi:hypothetical protein